MSRHRNVRNLTSDDYYDDYGDDDDYYDDYDEEDEDEYYKQQQEERKRREKEEALKRSHGVEAKIAAQKQKQQQQQQQQQQRQQQQPTPAGVAGTTGGAAKSATTLSSSATAAGGVGVGVVVSPGEKTERVRLLEGMGFTPVQAKSALEQYDWEVQKALDSLLLGGGGGGASAGETKKKVPPGGGGGGKKKQGVGSSGGGGGGGGVSKPPPGFGGRPDAAKKKAAVPQQDSGGGGGISKPPPGFARPPVKSNEDEQKRAMMEQFDASPPPGFGGAAGGGGGRKGGGGASSSVSPKKDTVTTPTKEVKFDSTARGKKGLSPPRTSSDATSSSSAGTADGPIPQLPQKVVDALKKQRSRLSMVILGHVDAGKSTLMGQVLLQLGHVEKRTVTKYQRQAAELGKASFALAWVMDEDESERERGVTMEIGTKYAKTPNHDLTILDAPGHADFIPAMITGAASADVGLLVVAATPGEFEAGFELTENTTNTTKTIGGQTREHIILSRGLGVSQLIVAINKLDASDPPWSQSRFEYIKNRLVPFLQLNGYNVMKRVRFVPISGYYGINVKEKPTKEAGAEELLEWYDGLTLLESIDGFLPAQRNLVKPLRFIVTDVYSEGKGVTARGRVVQGAVQIGEKVVVLPIGDTALVNKIEHGTATSASSSPYSYASSSTTTSSDDNNNNGIEDESLLSFDRTKLAIAGDTVTITLSNIDIARITPGCILSHTHHQLRPPVQKKIQAKILVMDQLDVPIIRGAQVLLHMHSIDVPATITKLLSSTKKLHNKGGSTKEMTMPRVVTGGSSATVEIKMNERICVETYNDCRSLGRFVLRRGGSTIAVGVVEKILG